MGDACSGRAVLRVAVKYFWTGSTFYPGTLAHCIALPLDEVPPPMEPGLKDIDAIAHFRFAPVPASVRQTIATLPGSVTAKGDTPRWHEAVLHYDPEQGFWFEPASTMQEELRSFRNQLTRHLEDQS